VFRLRCSRVLAAHSTVGPTNPDLEARWELAIKTVNQAGNTATTPAPGSTGLPAGPSLIYHASHRPMTIKPYRRAIQDRLRRRREAAGAPRLAPTSAEIAAHYATLPHPPSIKDASDLCGFTPTQHIQFTLLALVVLREGAQRCQLTDSDGHRALWDAVISDIDRVIGAEPVYLLSQGVAGAGKTYALQQLYNFAAAWGLTDAIMFRAPTGEDFAATPLAVFGC